ncbi:MAG: cyclic pyranopterin monophosphate synthase MoaC [Bacteroidia bacterium]|jgi:cyclic pyranopterin phosphate synthase|uniref:Cyclic pyranopterin monophosphate synthase n=1 Tax=bioreactor metagenome TaxID=1076179 RepID=A0A645IWG1_9ZZZZ|nr:cyclic pyranopterin monophosphate synthase MoaC [Rikenellaceae bacterium]NCB18042.1 cyclic pyranopterin monophosphate synthase MoaC [Bacteroidia bacterium]
MENKKLTHLDNDGNANMVDVGQKAITARSASASGHISLSENTIELILENRIKKGSVLTVAKIAGIMAAKKTSDIIPLCHPLLLNVADVNLTIEENGVKAVSYVSCNGNTGVEMEALNAVSSSLLTIYDMCKAVDKEMVISGIKLLSKEKKEIL